MLSICIPTRQRAEVLREGLDRLAFTRHLPFPVEVIVTDNASTDGTKEVVESFLQKIPIRYFRHSEDRGAEANLLSAFRRARGTWCVYLADDDFLEPEALQKTIQKLEKTPGAVAAYAPWEQVDGLTGAYQGPALNMGPETTFRKEEAMLLFGRIAQNWIFPEIGIYRTEAAQRWMTPVQRQHWAFVWIFRMLKEGPVLLQPEPFYHFQTRNKHATSHLGVEQVIERLDHYRAGMEEGLRLALQLSPPARRPEYQKLGMELVTHFMAGRIWNAANVAMKTGRFRVALELSRRLQFYPSDMPEFPRQLVLMALVEELKEGMHLGGVQQLVVPEGADLDGLVEAMLRQGIRVQRGSLGPEKACLVRQNEERRRMVEEGAAPEQVFSVEALLAVVS